MADLVPLHHAALAGARSGAFGANGYAERIALKALPEGHVLQVLASSGSASDVAAMLSSLADGTPYSVRVAGPGQWLVVGDDPFPQQALVEARISLKSKASIVDQSHGRVRIGLSGAAVETVLAKGTAVDLDPSVFQPGMSAMTLIGHISVHLTRVQEHSFEVLVLRGFAASLWEDLITMSLEFGVDVTASAASIKPQSQIIDI